MPTVIKPEYAMVPAAEARSLPYGWGKLTFLADATSGTSPDVSMAFVTIAGRQRNMLHRHANCDELLYLLKGKLRHLAGEEWVVMNPGDTIRITRGVSHQAEVMSEEDAEMIVVYSAGDRETEMLS